jgi:glutamine amidotransferase
MLDPHLVEGCKERAEGDTDSEQVALYLVDRIDDAIVRKGESLSFDERFEVLACEVEALSWGNTLNNKLNLLIDDGTYIYLHTNTVNPTLYVRTSGDAAFFCTRPLPDGDGWQEMPTNCLVAYCDGQLVRTAARHEHSIDEEAYMQSIAGMSPVS